MGGQIRLTYLTNDEKHRHIFLASIGIPPIMIVLKMSVPYDSIWIV